MLCKTINGHEKAKCAEVAANIAVDVLKLESEGIKAIKEIGIGYYGSNDIIKGQRVLDNIRQSTKNGDGGCGYIESSNSNNNNNNNNHDKDIDIVDDNRKF